MVNKQIQIENHVLLLKHEKLDDKASEDLLKKYNISKTQLPKIYRKDFALKGMEVNAGDIIEVERKSPTAGKIKFYRMIVDGS
ncbi:DNA-directed RNA polymerase subunit H [Candidatus Woesearchaeota archaeon]|nr:DNA-directed RNA polymerase subunit H [Candidatus Woesearchaeota archaeon]